jgi:hypothetical protein
MYTMQLGTCVLLHTLYSPDMGPINYFLCPKLEKIADDISTSSLNQGKSSEVFDPATKITNFYLVCQITTFLYCKTNRTSDF